MNKIHSTDKSFLIEMRTQLKTLEGKGKNDAKKFSTDFLKKAEIMDEQGNIISNMSTGGFFGW